MLYGTNIDSRNIILTLFHFCPKLTPNNLSKSDRDNLIQLNTGELKNFNVLEYVQFISSRQLKLPFCEQLSFITKDSCSKELNAKKCFDIIFLLWSKLFLHTLQDNNRAWDKKCFRPTKKSLLLKNKSRKNIFFRYIILLIVFYDWNDYSNLTALLVL